MKLYLVKYHYNESVAPEEYLFYCNKTPTPKDIIRVFNIDFDDCMYKFVDKYFEIKQIIPQTIIL